MNLVVPTQKAKDSCWAQMCHRRNVIAADPAIGVAPGRYVDIPSLIAGAAARELQGARFWELRVAANVASAGIKSTGIQVLMWRRWGVGDNGRTVTYAKGVIRLDTAVQTDGAVVANKHPFTGEAVAGTSFYEADGESAAPAFDGGDLVGRDILAGDHAIFTIDIRGWAYGFVRVTAVPTGARVEVGDALIA